jgi:hypothetical protein
LPHTGAQLADAPGTADPVMGMALENAGDHVFGKTRVIRQDASPFRIYRSVPVRMHELAEAKRSSSTFRRRCCAMNVQVHWFDVRL